MTGRAKVAARVALFLALVLPTPASGQGSTLDATTRDFDQIHLALDLDLDFQAARVRGTATLAFEPLRPDFRLLRLHGEELQLFAARLRVGDGEAGPVSFRSGGGIIEIACPRPIAKGERAEVVIHYEAEPRDGLFFKKPTAENPEIPLQVWSQGQANFNRYWFPAYDLPDDRLTTEVRVRVPSQMMVVSNGTGGRTGNDGATSTWHFRQEIEHCTYLVTLIAGSFETDERNFEDIPIRSNVPPGRLGEAPLAFRNTPGMMAFLSEYTGRRYAYPSYTQTTIWDFNWGGMENTSATTLNLRTLHDETAHLDYEAEPLVCHELAHQWFGDLITCRTWDEIWLNEGFATYFESLYVEHVHGRERFLVERRAAARAFMDASPPDSRRRLRERAAAQTAEAASRPADGPQGSGQLALRRAVRTRIPHELTGGLAYTKGSSVLHLLRGVMGDDAFRRGIRRYVKENENRPVVTEDLRRALEAEAGRSLAPHFDDWVYGVGFPEFEVTASWGPRQGVALAVRQIQDPAIAEEVFRVPVRVAVVTGDENDAAPSRREETFEIDERQETFFVPCDTPPLFVRFDVEASIPKRIRFRMEPDALAAMLRLDIDVTGRMDAAEALGDLGAAGAPALVAAAGTEASPFVRAEIARSLGRITAGDTTAALLRLLGDPVSAVRAAAARALTGRREPAARDALTAAIGKDPSYAVVGEAARALGTLGFPEASETLRRTILRPSYRDQVRRGAADGLASLGNRDDLGLILELIDYRHGAGIMHEMAREAIDAAWRLARGDPACEEKARNHIIGALANPYFRTRSRAADLLGRERILLAIPALVDRLEVERNLEVREALKSAIKAMGRP